MDEDDNGIIQYDRDQVELLIDLIRTNDMQRSFELIINYFEKKYADAGCSIFLVNNSTDELELKFSKKIQQNLWKESKYERGEGFTGWVFKFKKTLYIKNEMSEAELSSIYPEKPVHAGKKKKKPIEVDSPFPYLAAPIISKGTLDFCSDDFIDIVSFIKRLKEEEKLKGEEKNPFISYILEELNRDGTINDFNINFNTKEKNDYIEKIVIKLNVLLRSDVLIDKFDLLYKNSDNYIDYENLNDDIKKWLELKSKGIPIEEKDLIILNRTVIDYSFPDEIEDRYVIGVIRLSAMTESTEFSANDIEIFEAISSRISAPIENFLLLSKQERLIETYAKIGTLSNLEDFSQISLSDIKNPKGFAIKLNRSFDKLSSFIKNFMPMGLLENLVNSDFDENFNYNSTDNDESFRVLDDLVKSLNEVVKNEEFCNMNLFKNAYLSRKTKLLVDFLKINPLHADFCTINKYLLEEAYPNEIGRDPIIKLLYEIVSDIPEIVGGGGCSIFLHQGEKTKYGDKKFILRASTALSRGFLQHIPKEYFYCESEKGLTPCAILTKSPLNIINIRNKKELEKIDEKLVHTEGGPCEIISNDVGPFLAVPITNQDGVLGIIRIPRRHGAKPFDIIDKTLICAFANQLSLVIWNLNRKDQIEKTKFENLLEFHKRFSLKLIEEGLKLSSIDYSPELKEFFTKGTEDDLYNRILNLLDNLWCNKYEQTYNFPILKDFRSYEKMLLELPRYRDHFIHQFQVFVLGAIIIDKIKRISQEAELPYKNKDFSYYYKNSLKLDENNYIALDSEIAWLICSSFHDVAYPIERSDQIFNKFFDKFMGLNINIIERIGLEKVIFDGTYSVLMDELCDFYVSIIDGKLPWEFRSANRRGILIDNYFSRYVRSALLEKRDHGVLGSLILLHQSRDDDKYSKIIFPASLAISLHNTLLSILSDKIVFEKNPLTFLLVYCDLVQEWGRSVEDDKEMPILQDIKVELLEDTLHNKLIHVKTEIILGNLNDATNKVKEAEAKFSRLISQNIVFEFEIKDLGRKFVSRREC